MKKKITMIGRLFAVAAMLFGATSWANAQETVTTDVALNQSTKTALSEDNKTWTFGDYVVTNAGGKTYGTSGSINLKWSATTFTVAIPEGKQVVSFTIQGASNYDDGTSRLHSLNGVEFAEDQYVLPVKGEAEVSHTVALATPVTGSLEFTIKGKQLAGYVTLGVQDAPSIGDGGSEDGELGGEEGTDPETPFTGTLAAWDFSSYVKGETLPANEIAANEGEGTLTFGGSATPAIDGHCAGVMMYKSSKNDALNVANVTDAANHTCYSQYTFPSKGCVVPQITFFYGDQTDAKWILAYSVDGGTTWKTGGEFTATTNWNAQTEFSALLNNEEKGENIIVRIVSSTANSDTRVKSFKAETTDKTPADVPVIETNLATVSYAAGEALGTLPAAETLPVGAEYTLPANRAIYVEGKSFTGWSDGVTTYAAGAKYTLAADVTFTPVYAANTVNWADRKAATTVVWDFTLQNGAPFIGIEGGGSTPVNYVAQADVDGTMVDLIMVIDATAGKFNNSHGQWAQVNNGTKFTLPVTKGCKITLGNMGDTGSTTVGGETYTAGFEYTGDESTVVVDIQGGTWYNTVTIEYPEVAATPEPTPIKIVSVDPAGGEYAAPTALAADAKTITVTFDQALTDYSKLNIFFGDLNQMPYTHNCEYTVDGSVLTITRPDYTGVALLYIKNEAADANQVIADYMVYYDVAPAVDPITFVSIDPATGTYAEPAKIESTQKTFTVTFNNNLVATDSTVVYFGLEAWSTPSNCEYTIEGNTLTFTRPDAETPLAVGTYMFHVKATDVNGQYTGAWKAYGYYKVEESTTEPVVPMAIVSVEPAGGEYETPADMAADAKTITVTLNQPLTNVENLIAWYGLEEDMPYPMTAGNCEVAFNADGTVLTLTLPECAAGKAMLWMQNVCDDITQEIAFGDAVWYYNQLAAVEPEPEVPASGEITATWALTDGGVATAAEASVAGVLAGEMAIVSDFSFAGTEAWKNAAGETGDPAVVFTKFSPATKHSSPDQAALKFTITPERGMIFTPTKVKVNAARFGSDSQQFDVYVTTSAGSVKLNAETIAPARSKKDDTLYPSYTVVDLAVADITVEKEPVVIEFWVKADNGRAMGLNNLVVEGTFVKAEPAKVAYLCGATETTEAVYAALVAAGLNVTPLNYNDVTLTGDLEADGLAGYDLVVLAGATGSGVPLAASFNTLLGKVPVLSTKAFWYAKITPKGSNGGNPGSADAPSMTIVRDVLYAGHNIFEGIEGDTITVWANAGKSTGRYMQSNGKFAEETPAQATLATAGGQNAIAEAWVDGVGYMIIPFDADADYTMAANALTEDGVKLFTNAALYLLDGKAYDVPYLGDCTTPVIETVALEGEHAGKYQLNITATPAEADIYYTLDGTEPSATNGKLYVAPDTLTKSCTVKAIAYAVKYHDSEVATYEFVNASIVTPDAPVITLAQGEKSVTITIAPAAALEGLNIYYTLDGSEPTLESAVYTEPIEYYGESCTVKAIAGGAVYNNSAVAEQAVANANYVVRGKVMYTTNFHDPLEEWFYPVEFTYEEGKIVGAIVDPTKIPAGVTYSEWTEKDGFRFHIFAKNDEPATRIYNEWSFTTVKKGRRIILGNKSSYLWLLNDASDAIVTKNEAFAGPFDVELQLTNKTAGDIAIYVGDTFDGENWTLIASGNTNDGVLRGSYNGTDAKYVRFVTNAKEVYINQFTIYGEGLPELELESVSPAGGTNAEPVAIEATLNTIEVTYNNTLAATQGEDLVIYFGPVAAPSHNCTYVIEGNKIIITRPDAAAALAAGKYVLAVRNATDIAGQKLTITNQFYTVAGEESGIDQAEAEKEVVRVEYISISGVVTAEPAQGLNFKRTYYADGTVEVERVLVK